MGRAGTLWIHVGTHKTGTTSIQEALHLRRAVLKAADVAVYPARNAWMLANLFVRPELRTTPRVSGKVSPPTPAQFDAGLEKMRAVCAGPCSNAIVSSEEFCLLRTSQEAEALRGSIGAMFEQVVPICVFRNEADWRESRRDQLRKNGYWDLQKALDPALSTDGDWYYDTAAILEFWQQLGPVEVIDYDEVIAAQGSVLPAFAQVLSQPAVFDGLDLRLNTRSGSATPMCETKV